MAIKRFEELRVYQMAFEAAMRIFELSKAWPKEELYSLTDQIRRASRSVCANIAEGWRKRRYQRHFISKLTDADGEAAETRVFLSFAFHCGYLEESDYIDLDKTYDRINESTSITRGDRMLPATSIARHSRVNSSITVRHLSCWPLAHASKTKS